MLYSPVQLDALLFLSLPPLDAVAICRHMCCRYQPHHDILVSTSWGAPASFFKGFNPAEVPDK